MATKYCDVSLATGLNDGTSIANAWQSLVDVLDGTPTSGSYSGGDTIIIRTADSGGNLSESRASSLTTPVGSGASKTNEVEWRLDDGTVWAESGTFELTFTGGSNWNFGDFNWLNAGYSGTRRFEVKANSASDWDLFTNNMRLWGLIFVRGTTPTSSHETRVVSFAGGTEWSTFVNCAFSGTTPEGGGTDPANEALVELGPLTNCRFLGCEFTLNSGISDDSILMTLVTNLTCRVEFFGCKCIDTLASHKVYSGFPGSVRVFWCFMKDCDLGNIDEAQNTIVAGNGAAVEIISEANAGARFFKRTFQELTEYNPSGNYPTLNATIPDSSTPWSVKVWPDDDNCSSLYPASIGKFTKWYNGTAATKDIRIELLIKDTTAFSSPQNDEWWVDITYVNNSDDRLVRESSRASGALTTSTESWSATTYGGNNYDKYKIVVTTANSIKQYTFVSVLLFSDKPAINAASSAAGDFYFVDPDFQIE